jgi:chromate transporter
MYFCAVAGMILSIRDDLRAHRASLSGRKNLLYFLKEVLVWLLLLAVCSLPALLLTEDTPLYLMRGFFSSIISFGGGDAYLSVADGLFVSSGMVTYQEFYSLLVPVANVLPGSILSKILTGVGY